MLRFVLAYICLGAALLAQTDPVAAGRGQFLKSCAFCHGPDASGGEGPNLILSSAVRHDKGGDLIGEIIHQGRPGKGMPAIALTPEQITDVVLFLHARVKESDRRSAGRPNGNYSLARLDTGDPQLGERFFRLNCAACHSPSGDLRGIAGKYSPVDLQTRMLYPPDVKQTATVRSSGKTATGTVVYEDAFTLALRDSAGWYHSWPRNKVTVKRNDPLAGHLALLNKYAEADLHNIFSYLETLR